MDKIRKTINISLQSKKYGPQMNELINKWEQDGDNISFKFCEMLLKFENLLQSATFLKVLNVFELTEKMATVYELDDKDKIEEILSKVVQIDNTSLSEIFMTFNQIQESHIVEPKRNVEIVKPIKKETIKQEPIKVEEPMIEEEVSDDEVPMDFLFNS